MKRKPNIIVDALKLFCITVLAGLLLGGVHYITKEPIARAEAEAKDKAYREVLASAETFTDSFEDILEKSEEILADEPWCEGASINGILTGKNSAGETVGYVVLASSSKSYGGEIGLVVGTDTKGIVTGISVLTINDTPGLGMKAKEESFRNQFVGVDNDLYEVVKTGSDFIGQVDAISSATITSKAFTAAVNGAKLIVKNCIEEVKVNE